MSDAPQVPVPDGPAGLLLSRDLIFTTKITGTASALGARVVSAGGAALAKAMLGRWRPAVVFVDLAAGDLVTPEAIAEYRALAESVPFVAFGSHVDVASLDAARQAGCEHVMPRSKFSGDLPALIAQFLPKP